MKIGPFKVEQLSEGKFEVFDDGHINRLSANVQEKKGKNRNSIFAPSNSAIVGINPVLVSNGDEHIIIDPGLGWGLDTGSDYTDVSNIRTNLQIFNLAPANITHVILTHLHYDHAAGSSYSGENSAILPTFPNATYHLHEKEWKYALTQTDTEQKEKGAGYYLDDFYRLIADQKVNLINENMYEVLSGVSILWTGGHTPGHQIVRLGRKNNYAYYLGDLLPSEHHLNHYGLHQMDVDPVQAKKKKVQLLRQAHKEQAVMLFYHSKYAQSGKLVKNEDKQYMLLRD